MTADLVSTNSIESVFVKDGIVYIQEFKEDDSEVVKYVESTPDTTKAIRDCLRVGARAVSLGNSTLDTNTVELAFSNFSNTMRQEIEKAVEEINTTTDGLLNEENGQITKTLNKFNEGFDPDSKTSVQSTIEKLVEETVQRLISPDVPDNPINRLKKSLEKSFNDNSETITNEVRILSEHILPQDAVAQAEEKGTAKGTIYEELVFNAIARLASPHGDDCERTGNITGAQDKKGDAVVTVNKDDSFGSALKILVEAKDAKLSKPEAKRELDGGMSNRSASVGVLVFKTLDQSPYNPIPFFYHDNCAYVVYNPEDDIYSIQLAYMWARWQARRILNKSSSLDEETIKNHIMSIRTAIDTAKTIKSNHTRAKKSIEAAGEGLDALVNSVEEALSLFEAELNNE
jgi:hypothetical protein